MAELDGTARNAAHSRRGVRLAPAVGEADAQDITSSKRFGPFELGDYVTISSTKDFFMRTGGGSVEAAATNTPLTAGAHDFVIPTGVTHVAIFSAEAGAKGAGWKS